MPLIRQDDFHFQARARFRFLSSAQGCRHARERVGARPYNFGDTRLRTHLPAAQLARIPLPRVDFGLYFSPRQHMNSFSLVIAAPARHASMGFKHVEK